MICSLTTRAERVLEEAITNGNWGKVAWVALAWDPAGQGERTPSEGNHKGTQAQKNPMEQAMGLAISEKSAETNLAEDALASQKLSTEADHKTEHGQATIPGLSE
jgi:hypothetical protein